MLNQMTAFTGPATTRSQSIFQVPKNTQSVSPASSGTATVREFGFARAEKLIGFIMPNLTTESDGAVRLKPDLRFSKPAGTPRWWSSFRSRWLAIHDLFGQHIWANGLQ